MKRVIPFILAVLTFVGLLAGCGGGTAAYTPEHTLSPEALEELKNNITTMDIEINAVGLPTGVKYKSEYSDMFENRELAEHVLKGFKTGFYWYQVIKNNLYQYPDGTVRINFSQSILYYADDIPEDHHYDIEVFEDAMYGYKSDYRFDDREGLNGFEVYLVDLLEGTATNVWWIGYMSNRRVELEQYMQEAQQKDEKLGITTEALGESAKTEYEISKRLGSDIQTLEDQLTELAMYFDIPWVEPEAE